MERIGNILRRQRIRRGDDLQHIAEYLCIRRSFLEAIEESRYEEFTAEAYIIGFLRSYAEYLGLDGKATIDYYRAEMSGRRKKPVLSMPTPIPEGRAPSVFVLVGAVVAAILVYAVWYGLSTSDRAIITPPLAPPQISSTTETAPSATASAPAASPAPTTSPAAAATPVTVPYVASPASSETPAQLEPSPTAKPAVPDAGASVADKPPHLVIRADQSSWVMVSDAKGKTLFDRVLKPGETLKVPDGPGFSLTTGNGAGIALVLDGNELPRLSSRLSPGSSGILRDIPLDTGHLRAILTPRAE